MFLKFQDRYVGSKYFMNLSLQLQFAYLWYCLKSSPLCWVTGQLFAATVANLIFLVASEVLIFIHCHTLPHPRSSLLPDLSSRIPSGIGSKTNLAVSWPAIISSKIWNFLVYLMICKVWPSPWNSSPGLWEPEGRMCFQLFRVISCLWEHFGVDKSGSILIIITKNFCHKGAVTVDTRRRIHVRFF